MPFIFEPFHPMKRVVFKLRFIRAPALSVLFILSFQLANAQLTGRIKDSESDEPIPYANVQVLDKNSGASSDEQGKFILPDADSAATIVISATGYETLQTAWSKDAVVLLHKTNVRLQEVTINSNRRGSLFKTGTYKKSGIRMHFAVNKVPWILVRYFPYDTAYRNTPFLKSVMVETESDVKDAVFNLMLYRKSKEGLPGEFLYTGNIIGHAKKGKHNTVIDLSGYDIAFPEEGLCIGIEFMLVAQNQYTIDVVENGKRNRKELQYAPRIGALPVAVNDQAMIFSRGKWEKLQLNTEPYLPKAYQGKYSLFAMELTLSD